MPRTRLSSLGLPLCGAGSVAGGPPMPASRAGVVWSPRRAGVVAARPPRTVAWARLGLPLCGAGSVGHRCRRAEREWAWVAPGASGRWPRGRRRRRPGGRLDRGSVASEPWQEGRGCRGPNPWWIALPADSERWPGGRRCRGGGCGCGVCPGASQGRPESVPWRRPGRDGVAGVAGPYRSRGCGRRRWAAPGWWTRG